jgi:hypothetical protein
MSGATLRLALCLAIAAGLGVAGWRLYAKGWSDARADQDRTALKAQRERVILDETLAAETPAEVCRRLGGGARCDGVR